MLLSVFKQRRSKDILNIPSAAGFKCRVKTKILTLDKSREETELGLRWKLNGSFPDF